MGSHIDQHTLEKFVLTPEELSNADLHEINQHMNECRLCLEQVHQLKQYYESIQKELQSPPLERDRTLAEKYLNRKKLALPLRALEKKKEDALDAYAEIIEPYHRPMFQRIVRYVQTHPVRSVGGFSLAAALVIVALMMFKPAKDSNPAYTQAKDGFLIVNNRNGDELWRKHLGAEFATVGVPTYISQHLDRVVDVQDVDADGINEVLCIFGWTSMRLPFYNIVVCYNADGNERWKYELHRTMKFGGVLYSDQYRFYHMEAGDFTHSGNIEIIAAARHDPWNPNVLVRLDGRSGKFLSEFWHPGELREFDHKDLNHDGTDELVFGGQNNRLQHACVAVFDPREITGSAPAPEDYYPTGFPAGTEKYYITFPSSDMKQIATDITNEVMGLRITNDGMLEIMVNEKGPGAGTLYYYFDSSLACLNVKASDSFTAAHRILEKEGKLTTHIDADYLEALRRGVMYWDGDKFIPGVTMNRHYLESVKAPQFP